MSVGTGSTTYAINFGAVGVVGTFLGMPFEALILGALAGAIVQGRLQATTRFVGISNVLISTLIAGAFTPVIQMAAASYLHWDGPEVILRAAAPIVLGGSWPWILPTLSEGLKRLIFGLVDRFGGQRHD